MAGRSSNMSRRVRSVASASVALPPSDDPQPVHREQGRGHHLHRVVVQLGGDAAALILLGLQHPCQDLAAVTLALGQRPLRHDALGDVREDAGDELDGAAAPADREEVEQERPLTAGSARLEVEHRLSRGEHVAERPEHQRAHIRKRRLHAHADVARRDPAHGLDTRVHAHDPQVTVADDDADRRLVQHHPQHVRVACHLLVHPLEGRDDQLLPAGRHAVELHRHELRAAGRRDLLHIAVSDARRRQPRREPLHALLGQPDRGQRPAEHLLRGPAHHPAERLADMHRRAVPAADEQRPLRLGDVAGAVTRGRRHDGIRHTARRPFDARRPHGSSDDTAGGY
jgi:hypothetical protein